MELFSELTCRICAIESEENERLFKSKAPHQLTESGEMLANCLVLELIPTDGYPKTICFRCNTQLRMFSEFRRSALHVHQKFTDKLLMHNQFLINQGKTKTESLAAECDSSIAAHPADNDSDDLEHSLIAICGEPSSSQASELPLDQKLREPSRTSSTDENVDPFGSSVDATDTPPINVQIDILHDDDENYTSSYGNECDDNSQSVGDEDDLNQHLDEVSEEAMDVMYLDDSYLEDSVDAGEYDEHHTSDDKKYAHLNAKLEVAQIVERCADRSFECERCDRCGKPLRQQVKTHICVLREEFKCKVCRLLFATKQRRDFHQARHTTERPVPCTICGKGFKNKYDLKIHQRMHDDERKYVCDICGNAFRAKTHLRNHIDSHTKVNRYACTMCERKYKTQITLTRHIVSMHTNKDEFVCNVCGKAFGLKFRFERHMKIHERQKHRKHSDEYEADYK